MEVINKFKDEYAFLNGFFESPISYNYRNYICSESAYHSQKVLDGETRTKFETMDGLSAYKLGKEVKLRACWDGLKSTEMYNVTWCKFIQNESLADLLLATEDKFLIDVNTYDDKIWGICNGVGENIRGFILMNIRSRLKTIRKQGIETYYDVTDSEFYDKLNNFDIDFEFSMSSYKDEIINKFIDCYGYNELLLILLPSLVDDNDSLNGEFDEEIDFISQLAVGDF